MFNTLKILFFALLIGACATACGDDASKESKDKNSNASERVILPADGSSAGQVLYDTCVEAGNCVLACEDDNCTRQCVENSTPESIEIFQTYLECGLEFCPGFTQECMSQNCSAQEQACNTHNVDTTGNPGGSGSSAQGLACSEVIDCFTSCETDACTNACIDSATPEALTKLDALLACDQACQESGGSMCLDTVCAPEVEACAFD